MQGSKPATEVRIQKNGLAVKAVNLPNLHLYPNPADRHVRLKGAQAGMPISV